MITNNGTATTLQVFSSVTPDKVKDYVKSQMAGGANIGSGMFQKIDTVGQHISNTAYSLNSFKSAEVEAFKAELEKSFETLKLALNKEAEEKRLAMINKKLVSCANRVASLEECINGSSVWTKFSTITNGYTNNYYDQHQIVSTRGSNIDSVFFSDYQKPGDSQFYVFWHQHYSLTRSNNNIQTENYKFPDMIVGKVIVSESGSYVLSDGHIIIKDGVFQEFKTTDISKKDQRLIFRAVFGFKETIAQQFANSGTNAWGTVKVDDVTSYPGESVFKEILQNISMVD